MRVRGGEDPPVACGWWQTVADQPPPKVASGSRSFDLAVIGAGFTGLACARRLAELFPAASIAVLEATRIAAGNSGRNSGFLLDASFYDEAEPAVQAARTRLQRGGLGELSRAVSEQRIDCDWQPWGNLYGSVTAAEDRHLTELSRRYADHGEPLEDWSAARMAETTGSTAFLRGVFHPGTVLVQPVELIRGLAATLPQNVVVFENSRALALSRRRSSIEVRTAESRVSAERVFLCANGGTPDLGHGRNRRLRVSTFAAMTPPLGVTQGTIGDAQAFGLLPCFLGGATLRKTREGRLLVRQSFAFTPKRPPNGTDYRRFVDQARETLRLRWPELGQVPFEFVWSGDMSLTRNDAQMFGQVEPNLYVAAFCNGAGNTSGTMAGKLLAELSAGQDSDLLADQLALPGPRRLPPEFICGFFVNRRIASANRRLEGVYAAVNATSD